MKTSVTQEPKSARSSVTPSDQYAPGASEQTDALGRGDDRLAEGLAHGAEALDVTDRISHRLGLGSGRPSMKHAATTAAAINSGTTIAAARATGNLRLS
jgi:hypothetical protein